MYNDVLKVGVFLQNVLKLVSQSEKQSEIIKAFEQSKRVTDRELIQLKEEIAKQQKIIFDLVKERDKAQNDSVEQKKKVT